MIKGKYYELKKKLFGVGLEGFTFDFIRNSYDNSQQIQKQRYGLTPLVGQKIRCQAVLLPGLRNDYENINKC